jgi:hypothetical protein
MSTMSRTLVVLFVGLIIALGVFSQRARSQNRAVAVCLVNDMINSEGAQVKVRGGIVVCKNGVWILQP